MMVNVEDALSRQTPLVLVAWSTRSPPAACDPSNNAWQSSRRLVRFSDGENGAEVVSCRERACWKTSTVTRIESRPACLRCR